MKTRNESNLYVLSFKSSTKEEALEDLCYSLIRDKPIKISSIEQLESSLSPQEYMDSLVMLTQLKVKTLLSENKFIQAYNELRFALERFPKNILLQLTYSSCILQCNKQLHNLLHDYPTDSSIDTLFNILKNESGFYPETLSLYSKYLISARRYHEAVQYVLPLISLFPMLRGLRNSVEVLAQFVPIPQFYNYLQKSERLPKIKIIKNTKTASQTYHLLKKYSQFENLIDNPNEFNFLEAELKKIIGEWPKTEEMDPDLKEFYFLKAITTYKRQNYLETIHCMEQLIALDPLNVIYRNYQREAVIEAFLSTHSMFNNGSFLTNLCEFYECYSKYGCSSYSFVAEVAKQHIREGRIQKAKDISYDIIALNPLDCDFLIAALDIALVAEDDVWISDILSMMTVVYKNRPWDLKLGSFLEEYSEIK